MKTPFYRRPIVWVISFFGVVFCLISLVNHFCFRTFGLDLGMFNQALYSYSQFRIAYFTQSINGNEVNYMGDHFSLITAILSPLRYVFGSYTLLIVQIIALLFSGYYIYLLAILKGISERNASIISIYFFSIWGLYSAIAYDFHTNVIAASFLPLVIYYYEKSEWWKVILMVVISLFCKENIGLWLAFVFFGLVIIGWVLQRKLFYRPLMIGLFCASYFFVVVFYLMPHINGGRNDTSLVSAYGQFGNSAWDIVKFIFLHPIDSLHIFLSNGEGEIAKVKMTTLNFILLSGGLFLILRPAYLFMIIPILAQKFLSVRGEMWDIHFQYSIEFAPILAFAAIGVISSIKKEKWQLIVISISALIAGYMSFREVINRSESANLFSSIHYRPAVDSEEFQIAFDRIPEDASVSCSSRLSPHLSFRDRVFIYPYTQGADFILLTYCDDYLGINALIGDNGNEYSHLPDYSMIYRGRTICLFSKSSYHPI